MPESPDWIETARDLELWARAEHWRALVDQENHLHELRERRAVDWPIVDAKGGRA